MHNLTYNTKQKQYIYDVLMKENLKQLTCDEITELLKKEGTPVGRSTVYRFLEKLAANGEIRKFSDFSNKSAFYQLVDKKLHCEEHLHLRCIKCGKLFHLGCDFMDGACEHILKHHGFRIDNSKTVILGLCENCTGDEVL